MRRQRLRLARLKHEPALTLGQNLLIGGQPRGDGDGSGSERPHECPRHRAVALGGEHRDIGTGQGLGFVALVGVEKRNSIAQPVHERRRRPPRPDRRVPVELPGQQAQRAQEGAQRRPFLGCDHHQLQCRVGRSLRRRIGAGPDHPVVTGEVALEQVAGRRVAGRARIQPREQQP